MKSRTWRGILALDRLLQRVPAVVEIWFIEFVAVISLSLGLARVGDGLGITGCPPAAEGIDATALGTVAFGLAVGCFVVWQVFRPRVINVTWTPVFVARDVAGLSHLPVPMPSATVTYPVLNSHPSYALTGLLTLPVPLVGLLGAAGGDCSMSFFRLFGPIGIGLLLLLALLRVVVWYGLRRGRAEIEAALPPGWSMSRLEWEMAWRPMLTAAGLVAACVLVPLAISWLGSR
jgi:hypothetical protein